MRARYTLRPILAILCFLVALSASADDGKFHLPVGGEVYTLNKFSATDPSRRHCGVYTDPADHTGGTAIHLFPNERFVIVRCSDIGADDVQAVGSYKVQEDRLVLEFSRVASGHEDLRKRFADLHLLWGWIEKSDPKLGIDYVTGFEAFIFMAADWESLKTKPKDAKYLQLRTSYPDWEKILRDYETQKP